MPGPPSTLILDAWTSLGHKEALDRHACLSVPAAPLDEAVANRLVGAVTPATIQLALAALTTLEEREQAIAEQWRRRVERSVMLMPSLVCLLGAVDAINRASLQFRETGEGVVGIREQEAVGGRVADNGDCPVANAPFNPIA